FKPAEGCQDPLRCPRPVVPPYGSAVQEIPPPPSPCRARKRRAPARETAFPSAAPDGRGTKPAAAQGNLGCPGDGPFYEAWPFLLCSMIASAMWAGTSS